METTPYFSNKVIVERPYIQMHCLRQALLDPLETLTQEDGRIRRWIYIEEYKKYLRVVTLADGKTIHNAFFDRGYKGVTK